MESGAGGWGAGEPLALGGAVKLGGCCSSGSPGVPGLTPGCTGELRLSAHGSTSADLWWWKTWVLF